MSFSIYDLYYELYKRSDSILLTNSNKSVTLENVWYDKLIITTNYTPIPGRIVYKLGHVHTNSCKKPSGSKPCGGSIAWGTGVDYGGPGDDGNRHKFILGTCRSCGAGYNYPDGMPELGASSCTRPITTYAIACGYTEYAYVRDVEDISLKTANETILSATITYDH